MRYIIVNDDFKDFRIIKDDSGNIKVFKNRREANREAKSFGHRIVVALIDYEELRDTLMEDISMAIDSNF